MNDLISSALVILATIILVAAIFLLSGRAKKKREGALRQLAAEHGWTFEFIRERLVWGYRMATAQWTFEAISRANNRSSEAGSSDVAHTTCWSSALLTLPERLVLIGERRATPDFGGFGALAMQKLMQILLGDELKLALGLKETQAGSEALRKKYWVWAHDPADAAQLLTPQVEHALLEWPGKPLPVIKLSTRGIRIEISNQRVEKTEDILAIVALGKLLLNG